MLIELNIGLNIESSVNTSWQRDSRADFALKYLAGNAITQNILASKRVMSGTEETLVVQLQVSSGTSARLLDAVSRLAYELDQDCIAMYNVTEYRGELVGPDQARVAKWGEFNPEFFIRADTQRPAFIAP